MIPKIRSNKNKTRFVFLNKMKQNYTCWFCLWPEWSYTTRSPIHPLSYRASQNKLWIANAHDFLFLIKFCMESLLNNVLIKCFLLLCHLSNFEHLLLSFLRVSRNCFVCKIYLLTSLLWKYTNVLSKSIWILSKN